MARIPFDPRLPGALRGGVGSGRRPGYDRSHGQTQADSPAQFRSLNAALLFCPTCQEATPARERLLLVLPSGNKYEYRCALCGTSTGEKTDHGQQDVPLIVS